MGAHLYKHRKPKLGTIALGLGVAFGEPLTLFLSLRSMWELSRTSVTAERAQKSHVDRTCRNTHVLSRLAMLS